MTHEADGAEYDLTVRSALKVAVRHVGDEREPVLVADDVMAHPQALVDYAAREVQFQPPAPANNFYPGVTAPAPLPYVAALVAALRPAMERAFELADAVPAQASCNYSIVTTPPDQLATAQRLPHVDTDDPLRFAFLHYLCDGTFGGTAFYRHRATGWESLTPERSARHEALIAAETVRHPPSAAYICGDSPLYARTAEIEARFDRLIVYRSRVFHSGQIVPGTPLDPDPRRGRLTANIFLTYARM